MSVYGRAQGARRLHGRYHDRLLGAAGAVIQDRGWRPNLIVDRAHVLIAALLKNEPDFGGLLFWAVGGGDPAWDGNRIEPEAAQATLFDEAARRPLAASDIRFVDADGRVSASPTDQLEVRAVFEGDQLAAGGVLSLREFGVFGGDAGPAPDSGYLLDHVIHPRIDLVPGVTLERSLRLSFVEPAETGPPEIALGENLSVRMIEGVGTTYAARLTGAGVARIGDLAALPPHLAVAGIPEQLLRAFRAKARLVMATHVEMDLIGPLRDEPIVLMLKSTAQEIQARFPDAVLPLDRIAVLQEALAVLQLCLDDRSFQRLRLSDLV